MQTASVPHHRFVVCAERLKCVPAASQSRKQISREPETQKEFTGERGGGPACCQGGREDRPKNESRIYFWRGLSLCVGPSFLTVLIKEKIRIALMGKYIRKKNTCWQGKARRCLAGPRSHRQPRPAPQLRPGPRPSRRWGRWPPKRLTDPGVLRALGRALLPRGRLTGAKSR